MKKSEDKKNLNNPLQMPDIKLEALNPQIEMFDQKSKLFLLNKIAELEEINKFAEKKKLPTSFR